MQTNQLSTGQYRVTATGFLSLFSIVGIMFYGLPFFFDFWVEEFKWSRAMVTSGNLAGKLIVGPLFGFVAGWCIDRFGPRRLMLSGILMVGLGVMGLGIMEASWQFYVFYFLIALGYMCGGPLPNQVLISRWFDKARGKAMGIAYLGIGVGGMLVPHIARWLNLQVGWHTALFALGVIIIAVAFPMAWFVQENPTPAATTETKTEEPKTPLSSVLKSGSFYLLVIGSMCSIGAVAGVSQNLKLFLSLDLQYSQVQSANVMSLVLGSSIIGRLLMGWLADKFPKKYVMLLIYAIVSLAILLLYSTTTPTAIYVFAVLFGIGLGGDYMIIPLMAAELFGVKVMGRVMGLVLTMDGLAEAFGPIMAGALRDKTGSYTTSFTALIVLSVLGCLAVVLLPKRRGNNQT
jgi:MFS family permease